MQKGYSLVFVLGIMLLCTFAAIGIHHTVGALDLQSGAMYHITIADNDADAYQRQSLAKITNDADYAISIFTAYFNGGKPIRISDSTYVVFATKDPYCLGLYTLGIGPMRSSVNKNNIYCFENLFTDSIALQNNTIQPTTKGVLDDAIWVGKTIDATASIYTVGGAYVGIKSNVTGSFTVNGTFEVGSTWDMTGSMAVYGDYKGPRTLSWPPHYITGSQTIKDTVQQNPITVNTTLETQNIHTWLEILNECGMPCIPFSSTTITGAGLDTAYKYTPSSYKLNSYLVINATSINFGGGTTSVKSYIKKSDNGSGKVPGCSSTGRMITVLESDYTLFEVDGTYRGLIYANGPTFKANQFTIDGSFVSSTTTTVNIVGALRADYNKSTIDDIMSMGIIVDGSFIKSDSTVVALSYTKLRSLSDILTSKMISSIKTNVPIISFDTLLCPIISPITNKVNSDTLLSYTKMFRTLCFNYCTINTEYLNSSLEASNDTVRPLIVRSTIQNDQCKDTAYIMYESDEIIISSSNVSSSLYSSSNVSSSLSASSSLAISSSMISCTPWSASQHWSTYTVGDKRSDGGKYWSCTNPSWAQSYAPSSAYGHYGWTQVSSCI